MRTIQLCKGMGVLGQSHCVMAATSIVAGEEFCDRPSCVCPTITQALIKLNDEVLDGVRNRLLGHLPWLIIGTRSPEHRDVLTRDALFEERVETFGPFCRNLDMPSLCSHFEVKKASQCNTILGYYKYLKRYVDWIESTIIPVYTTMPIEHPVGIERLQTVEA